jgi:hypothetical protein
MNWRLYLLKLLIVNRLPFANELRQIKRGIFGYKLDAANLRGTVEHFRKMRASLFTVGRSFHDATVLEIGSGWFPTIPILLSLEGARKVVMTDLTRHMDELTFASTVHFLRRELPEEERLNHINRISDLPLDYHAPFVVDRVEDGSLDFVFSRTVLEHIKPQVIESLLTTMRPKLKPNGLMLHIIDNSDHLQHIDKSISMINFLTWSKRKHALISSLMKGGENRLRHHEYRKIFQLAGFRVLHESVKIHEETLALAHSLPLVSPYSAMSSEELAAVTSFYILAAPQASELARLRGPGGQ